MRISPKELATVSALPGPKRYEYFIKKVADAQRAWGLYSDGWALAGDKDETPVFVLWPAREYAEACTTDSWKGYEPEAIELDDLMEELLPRLERDGVKLGVFFTPDGRGVTLTATEMLEHLRAELTKYGE